MTQWDVEWLYFIRVFNNNQNSVSSWRQLHNVLRNQNARRQGESFIPVALDVTGAQGDGVQAVLNLVKSIKKSTGKQFPAGMMAYWRRMISEELLLAVVTGARKSMRLEIHNRRLPGWNDIDEMGRMYHEDGIIPW